LVILANIFSVFVIPFGILAYILAHFQKDDSRKEKFKDFGLILFWYPTVSLTLSILWTITFNPYCFEEHKNIFSKDFTECATNPLKDGFR
jgi:hypothetical protein